jgi:GT2 family glycosyltransferase
MSSECAVVIATHNRAAVLNETLEQLCELPERPRIVVADNASTDETERVCKRFGQRVLLLKLRRNIGAAARTIGAREAGTPLVAFCDDDCVWTAGSLLQACEIFARHPRVALLNGRVLVGHDARPDPACQAMERGACGDLQGIPIVFFMAGASVMRTRAFLECGGYHRRYFIGAEESLLSLDLAARGWELWYCRDITVRHRPSAINRDARARRRLVLRNRLWTVMLRHSIGGATRALLRHARMAFHDPVARTALREAISGLPWVLRERRRIPRDLERRVYALERADAR